MKLFIISMLSLLCWACQNKKTENMEQTNFPYMVTATAPEEYPTEVHIGYLLNQEKK